MDGRGAAAFSWGPGRFDFFDVTDRGTLRHRTWVDGTLTIDEDLGGTLASAPTAVAWAVDQAEVFAIFPDGQLWNRYWDGLSWHSWESLGGALDPASAPACSSWGAERLDVFARGRDGMTWHRWWDGARWVAWERLPA
jgi:sialidase-1